jgi:elongation factor Ts
VRRFVKYNLGEGLEKRSNDFAAEVAQQTAKKAEAPAPKKEEPKKEEEPKEVRHAAAADVCLLFCMLGCVAVSLFEACTPCVC